MDWTTGLDYWTGLLKIAVIAEQGLNVTLVWIFYTRDLTALYIYTKLSASVLRRKFEGHAHWNGLDY